MKSIKCVVTGMLVGILTIGGMTKCTTAANLKGEKLESDEKIYYIGDVDRDGTVGIMDVQEILRYILHMSDSNGYDGCLENKRLKFLEDIDEDGKITWEDAILALRRAMHIDEMSAAEIISAERNHGYEIIYAPKDMEQMDDMLIIDSEEVFVKLQGYLSGGHEEYQRELLDRYRGIFDQYNLLVVKASVFTDDTEDVTTSVVCKGKHVLAEVESNYVPRDAAKYQYAKFLCVDKNIIENDSIMEMECDGIVGRADILMMNVDESHGLDKDKNTVSFSEATPYRHLLKSVEDTDEYRQFLRERFGVRQTHFSKLSSSFFKNHAYAVFTYHTGRGSDEYRVLGMECENDVLHVKLQWYKSAPQNIGFVSGTHSVFVSVPTEMAAQVSIVELEVVPENGM